MNQQSIQDALEAHLSAFPLTIDIAWEDYEPKAGVAYLSPKLASCQRRTIGAGADGSVEYDGIYMVTVRRPADEGRQAAGQLAAALVAHFGRGKLVMTADTPSVPVILVDASEQPSSSFGNWISLPVSVTFTAAM